MRSITGGTDAISKGVAKLRVQQRALASELRTAEKAAEQMGMAGSPAVSELSAKHSTLLMRQKAVASELTKAHRAAAKLGQSGSADIDRLTRASRELEGEERDVADQLARARQEAARLGVEGSQDVARLRGEHERLGRVLGAQNLKLQRRKALQDLNLGPRTMGALRQLGSNFADVGRKAALMGGAIGAAGTALAVGFAKSGVETAARFETLSTVLTGLVWSGLRGQFRWLCRGVFDPFSMRICAFTTAGYDPFD